MRSLRWIGARFRCLVCGSHLSADLDLAELHDCRVVIV